MENSNTSLPAKILNRLVDWMDERFKARELFEALTHVYIPKNSRTYYLGGITLFTFGVQVLTGALLTLYYQPSVDTAYESTLFITSSVTFGWLVRSIHSWTANLMIIFCILHMLRVFFQGAYKRPRELTWMVGMGLLVVTLGFGFTGYLLPWDQLSYWATTVGSESFGAIPGIGEFFLRFLRGGTDVTGATLGRFYGLHTIWLPLGLVTFLGIHLMLMHQQGLANPDVPAMPEEIQDEKNAKPFFPNYVLDETIAWYVIIGILVILASLFPIGLHEPADPFSTPEHIKPEWYFLSVYQFLKLVPRTVGIVTPGIIMGLMFILPFLDRSPEVKPRKRKFIIGLGIIGIISVIGLTIWGWIS